MKRKLFSLLIVIGLLFITTGPALAVKSYYAERYDVEVSIQPDGLLNITETIAFCLCGGTFTYVYRELHLTNIDQIDSLQARMDGQVLEEGTQPGQFEINAGEPIRVTWHFSPISDSTHEFTLTYLVRGAIRQNAETDSLIWRAIPEDHDYSITRSVIRIEYPHGITPVSTPSLDGVSAKLETISQGAVFTTQPIGKDIPVDVSVYFPRGSLVVQPPAWQTVQTQQEQRRKMSLPYSLVAVAITGLLGITWVSMTGLRFRRSASLPLINHQNISAPPRRLAPALAASLVNSTVPFLGTLFDLAQRGVLRIEEGPKKLGNRTFDAILRSGSEELQPHEQIFVDALFRRANHDRVPLNNIASLAYDDRFSQALDRELTAAGWRDAQRIARRGRFSSLSFMGLIAGLILFFGGRVPPHISQEPNLEILMIGAFAIGAGAALIGVSLVGLLVAALISPLSDDGIQQAKAWNSFSHYLCNITRGREPLISPIIFERYLPYAAGFGIATEWAKFFKKQANIPTPQWFKGLQTSSDDGGFIAIMSAISSADASASAASGGDVGGASGGGSSGAG